MKGPIVDLLNRYGRRLRKHSGSWSPLAQNLCIQVSPRERSLLTMPMVTVHDKDVYRLPHSESLSTRPMWGRDTAKFWRRTTLTSTIGKLKGFCGNTGVLFDTDLSWTRKAKIVKRDLHCSGADALCCGIPEAPVGHCPQRTPLPQVEGPWRDKVPTPTSPIPPRYKLSENNTAQSSVSLLLVEWQSKRKMLMFAPTSELLDQGSSPPVSFLKKGNPYPYYC